MHPEVLSSFERHLPKVGPYDEDIVLNAVWSATGDCNKAHPVKPDTREFISPIFTFEIDTSVRGLE
jgi:hypothetical protein